MKGFSKATRTGFAVLLTLCMVMSLVTVVSADAAVIGTIAPPTKTTDGYYEVNVPVSCIAAGGDATILIYTGDAPTSETVKYANQDATVEGAKTFTAEIKKGSYTIVAGGTGVTADTETLSNLNSVPAFAADALATVSVDADATVIGTYAATDYDGDSITYSLSGSDATFFAVSDAGVITPATGFGEKASYAISVVANDGTESVAFVLTVNVTAATPYKIAADIVVPTVYVSADESYADYVASLPAKVSTAVIGNSGTFDVDVTWPATAEDFKATEGEFITVYGTLTDTETVIADGKTVSVKFQTADKTLGFTVNGAEGSVVAKAGKVVNAVATYFDSAAEYGFVVTDKGTAAVAADATFGSEATYTFGSEFPTKTVKTVTVFVKANGTVVASASADVYFANSLYYGYVYIDATEADSTYSALRVNKNAGMTVTTDFAAYDGSAITGTLTANVYAQNADGTAAETAAATKVFDGASAVFTAADLASVSKGAYRVVVTLSDGTEELYKAQKTTYISDIGVWYSAFTLNGSDKAVTVNKNKSVAYSIAFDDTPGADELFVGYDVVAYGDAVADKALTEKTTDGAKAIAVDLSDKADGAYTFFSLAKKKDAQTFYDFCFGKTIYVRGNLAQIANVAVNGSRQGLLGGADTLAVAPVWALGADKPENVTFNYSVYAFDASATDNLGAAIVTDIAAADDGETTLIDTGAQAALAKKNVVKVDVLVNGEADTTITRIFYK